MVAESFHASATPRPGVPVDSSEAQQTPPPALLLSGSDFGDAEVFSKVHYPCWVPEEVV